MALVYFVTALIFMAILSAVSVYLLQKFNVLDDDEEEETQSTPPVFTELFARVNSKGVLADMALIRIDPSNNHILIVPISAVTVDDRSGSETMKEVYDSEGMEGVRKAVEKTFGVSVTNYATVTNEAFERIADLFGGMTYSPDEELYYLSEDNDENDISIARGEMVNLTGRQIRLISQYPVFESGKKGNNDFLGLALETLINNAFQTANITADNLDNIYSIITENSDTDLTPDTFRVLKSYLKSMLQAGKLPAEKMMPEGTWTEDDRFLLSSDFREELRAKTSTSDDYSYDAGTTPAATTTTTTAAEAAPIEGLPDADYLAADESARAAAEQQEAQEQAEQQETNDQN